MQKKKESQNQPQFFTRDTFDGIRGRWTGTLKSNEGVPYRIAFEIECGRNGVPSARFWSLDEESDQLEVDRVAIDSDYVSLFLMSIDAALTVYIRVPETDGAQSNNNDSSFKTYKGTWSQAGVSYDTTLRYEGTGGGRRSSELIPVLERIPNTDASEQTVTIAENHINGHFPTVPEIGPQSLTVLPTYRCNAACAQCCFESNPTIRNRLDLSTIKLRMAEAIASFPTIRVVVFTGGECFLLGNDLYESILFASARGKFTRCVTNGFWGRRKKNARKVAMNLLRAGVHEINISTGSDHQEWVPQHYVVNAAEALVECGIPTLITIEADNESTSCQSNLMSDPTIKRLHAEYSEILTVLTNTWMPFSDNHEARGKASCSSRQSGCDQLFNNLVITPHDMLSACCGLVYEHIPEMKLGHNHEGSMREKYHSQFQDFLKIWIHVDGPYKILERLFGDEIADELGEINHICHACALMHQTDVIREELEKRYLEFVPEVMGRFRLKTVIRKTAMGQSSPLTDASALEA